MKLHNYSIVISKYENCCVVSCADYPKCFETITIFSLRDKEIQKRVCC